MNHFKRIRTVVKFTTAIKNDITQRTWKMMSHVGDVRECSKCKLINFAVKLKHGKAFNTFSNYVECHRRDFPPSKSTLITLVRIFMFCHAKVTQRDKLYEKKTFHQADLALWKEGTKLSAKLSANSNLSAIIIRTLRARSACRCAYRSAIWWDRL